MICGLAILSSLGFWQLRRLAWKENLIAMVEQRRSAAPLTLPEVEALWEKDRDVDFVSVSLSGVFDNSVEQYYYVTKNGRVGWHVYVPLKLPNGRIVIVNRGFVPDALRDPSKRLDGLIAGQVDFSGLARNAPLAKPNDFVPDNDLIKNIYHWKSLSQMAGQMTGSIPDKIDIEVIPFFIDAGADTNPGKLPEGGSTRVVFPNNHLQYAFTWFGLAFALLGVGSYFLYSRRN